MSKPTTFKHGIIVEGVTQICIAVFNHEPDRDVAIDALRNHYSDCEFSPVNDWDCEVDTELN